MILWLAGVAAHSASWTLWLVFAAGCLSILITAMMPADAPRAWRIGWPLVISAGLFSLWIIGVGAGKAYWKNWWTFAFACAYLLLAIGEGSLPARTAGPPTA